ncbi:MAG: hypothetical protein HY909_22240 [Deltaproteobacteria bacterium]|nr:hypothetical protein [Deltaproteobacteria bacterium]
MTATLKPPDGTRTGEYLLRNLEHLGDGDYGVLRVARGGARGAEGYWRALPAASRPPLLRGAEALQGAQGAVVPRSVVLLEDPEAGDFAALAGARWSRRALDLRMYHGTPESLDWLVQPVRPDAREAQSFEEALGRDDLGALTRAVVTVHLGWARLRGRAFDEAGRCFLEAEGAFSWSPWRAAECTLFRALSLLGGGDADGALALAEAAWSTFRAQAPVRGEAEALVVLARSRWRLGQSDKARATAREAVRTAERSSAGWAFADGLRQSVEYQDPTVPDLPEQARVAEVVFRALGDLSSAGQCQLALGRLLAARRAFPAAVKALRAARETLLPVSPVNAGNASLALARLLFKGGQRAAAAELTDEALGLQGAAGSALNRAHALEFRALLARDRGDHEGAARSLRGAERGFDEARRPRDRDRVQAVLGDVLNAWLGDLRAKRPEEALPWVLACLRLARRTRRLAATKGALELLATAEARARVAWLGRRPRR